MQYDSIALLDRAIADLEKLSTEFAAELKVVRPVPGKNLRHLRRKEALLTISILLPKLAAVRRLEHDPPGISREKLCD